jgi:ribosomal protein S3AE
MVSAAHLVASKAYAVPRIIQSALKKDAVGVDLHTYVKTNVAHQIALAARKSTTVVKLLRPAVIQRSAVMKSHLVAEMPENKVENVAPKKPWLVVVMGMVVPHLVHRSSMPYHVTK